ncbi:MAG: beta-propeller domain-containing protein [Bacteroidota bacterium]
MASRLTPLVVFAVLVVVSACAQPVGADRLTPSDPEGLEAFASDADLAAYVDTLRQRARDESQQRRRYESDGMPAAPEMAMAEGMADQESITNTQTAGVDEGGIVKRVGDHLLVLRRGRLFTVEVGGGALDPVATADAFGPLDPSRTWYDELLVVDRTAVVIGYSYARGGTELVLFDIARDGQIVYRSTYHLRSNDYYSAENYASRVVDGKLVFYTPLGLPIWDDRPVQESLPAMRRWTGDASGAFEPIASATRVYRPARDLQPWNAALHTVTSCAVGDGELDCDATAVFGPFGHTFYVSTSAVYTWLSGWAAPRDASASVLYRLPLDGGTPGALGVRGGPIDQFSFLESRDALHVVTSEWPGGQWMWNSERPRTRLSLARIPLAAIGDGSDDAPDAWYHPLAVPEGGVDVNRFVGEHLLYGSSWGGNQVQVVDWTAPGTVRTLWTGHRAERIEALGQNAVVVGSQDGDLHVSAVRLGDRLAVADTYRLADAAQGETRSHGFFYRPDRTGGGTLGLPIRRHGGRYASLRHGSASMVYLREHGLSFEPLGTLDASGETPDDACQASCADWYGNARPLFLGDRVLALMGYEIVEGERTPGGIRERRRASFAPTPQITAR